jgi:CheY-like chemotaxis protein
MPVPISREIFLTQLRRALGHLYDSYELSRSPLVELLKTDGTRGQPNLLKQALFDGITGLMPGASGVAPNERTSHDSIAWKMYELLYCRFIDQISQKETAKMLMVSQRTLQRLEPQAMNLLADTLAEKFGIALVEGKDVSGATDAGGAAPEGKQDQERGHEPGQGSGLGPKAILHQEMEFLRTAYQSELIDLNQVLREIEEIALSLAASAMAEVRFVLAGEPLLVQAQGTILRQAVLTTLSFFMAPGVQIEVSARAKGRQGIVQIAVRWPDADTAAELHPAVMELKNTLTELVGIIGAELNLVLDDGGMDSAGLENACVGNACARNAREIRFHISLAAYQVYKVLVVDDNRDAVRLVEKYLAGSPYTVIGAHHPTEALAKIQAEKPDLVILDVMLPDMDGWLLLGQIRRAGLAQGTPIIISTILPQEQLAASLGADDFIRKPFNQQEILGLLNRHLENRVKE